MEKGINFLAQKRTICLEGNLINLSTPVVMGIANVTTDSFYAPSRISGADAILARAEEILSQGGAIIDIGGYSSRPNAPDVSVEEEIRRVCDAVGLVKKKFPQLPISVDTFRSEVVSAVVHNCGAIIVNDISAGEMDDKMFKTVAQLKVPYIAMHMKGTPSDMQHNPSYHDIRNEIFLYFSKQLQQLRLLGVNEVILDPGFGFGKTVDHNYQILSMLDDFKIFGLPILVGFSRKSMIYKHLNSTPEESLNGTSVLNTVALLRGASILRVHDVKPAVEAISLVEKVNSSNIA
jgi:dihydropteroate synthase